LAVLDAKKVTDEHFVGGILATNKWRLSCSVQGSQKEKAYGKDHKF
jgi:hypothetical protein